MDLVLVEPPTMLAASYETSQHLPVLLAVANTTQADGWKIFHSATAIRQVNIGTTFTNGLKLILLKLERIYRPAGWSNLSEPYIFDEQQHREHEQQKETWKTKMVDSLVDSRRDGFSSCRDNENELMTMSLQRQHKDIPEEYPRP
jgi:hypothetical protein